MGAFSYTLGRQLGHATTRSAWLEIRRAPTEDFLACVITRSIKVEVRARGISVENIEPTETEDIWNVTVDSFNSKNVTQEYKGSIEGPSKLSGAESLKGKSIKVKTVVWNSKNVLLWNKSDLAELGIKFIEPKSIHGMWSPTKLPDIVVGEPVRILCEINFDPLEHLEDDKS